MPAPSPASTTSVSRAGRVREDAGSDIGHTWVVYDSRSDWAPPGLAKISISAFCGARAVAHCRS
jgi:hypothetical protein